MGPGRRSGRRPRRAQGPPPDSGGRASPLRRSPWRGPVSGNLKHWLVRLPHRRVIGLQVGDHEVVRTQVALTAIGPVALERRAVAIGPEGPAEAVKEAIGPPESRGSWRDGAGGRRTAGRRRLLRFAKRRLGGARRHGGDAVGRGAGHDGRGDRGTGDRRGADANAGASRLGGGGLPALVPLGDPPGLGRVRGATLAGRAVALCPASLRGVAGQGAAAGAVGGTDLRRTSRRVDDP